MYRINMSMSHLNMCCLWHEGIIDFYVSKVLYCIELGHRIIQNYY